MFWNEVGVLQNGKPLTSFMMARRKGGGVVMFVSRLRVTACVSVILTQAEGVEAQLFIDCRSMGDFTRLLKSASDFPHNACLSVWNTYPYTSSHCMEKRPS